MQIMDWLTQKQVIAFFHAIVVQIQPKYEQETSVQ